MNSGTTSDCSTIEANVRHWARTNPESVAVMSSDGDVLSYEALHDIVTATREQLRNIGISQHDKVGLLFAPSPVATAAFISVASNAISVPLNNNYKQRELESALKALRPRVLLIDSNLDTAGRTVAFDLRIPVIEVEPSGLAGQFRLNLENFQSDSQPVCDETPTASPDDIALMLHTSGSTGRPKCVPLTHRVICTGSQRTATSLELTQGDRCLNLLAPCHVHGLVSNTVMPLVSGGSIIATSGFQADRIPAWLLERQPTWISAPPSLQQQIAETVRASSEPIPKTSLRFLRSGSVPLWPELIDLLTDTFGVPIVEAYGMTEVPHISGNPSRQCRSGSVGKPLVDELAIVDSSGELLPAGEVGEIVLRGVNVTSGYLDAPEANDNTFKDGWFHTGDLGWLNEDGYLFLKGRRQEIINRGGNKVMPREVEEALIQHSSVTHAVVFPVAHPSLGNDVAAAVVLTAGQTLDESEVRRFAGKILADFKVPTRIVAVTEFPVEASGKINRARLEERLAHVLRIDFEAPAGSTEVRLAKIFQAVLRQDNVGRHDNFFALGGHSLLAARVMARVISEFEAELPLRSLFEFPTVKELSVEIEKWLVENSNSTSVPLSAFDRSQSAQLPLSFSQQRLWFLEQMEGELTAYNLPYVWKLTGNLDVTALERALEAIVRRHEPLRTIFAMKDGDPFQLVQPCEQFHLTVEDLRPIEQEDREAAITRFCCDEAERPFDLTSDLMLRGSLLRLADDEHLLLLTIHHIAFDGWSMLVLWRELIELYSSFWSGKKPSLPDLPVSYADYAVWQQSRLQDEQLSRLLNFWRGHLEGISPLELPTDHPRPATATHRGARHHFTLDEGLVRQLEKLALEQGATLHMTLLAAFKTLLARYSRQDDIAVATPVAGRSRQQLEDHIGFFVNTLVLRSNLDGNSTFRELLGQVRDNSLAAYDHQEMPFEKLVEELQPERDLSRSPLVQVLFQLMNFSEHQFDLPGLKVTRLPDSSHRVLFDLEMHLTQRPDGIDATLAYSTDLFELSTIDRMASQFISLLSGIVASPNVRLCELPMMTERERHLLLTEWNDTTVEYSIDRCVHELFEDQSERTPDAVAVIFETQELTYRELNQRANQLAHRLITLGVGPETLVGLCLDRSAELLVGILGILKAGGAYLPLDADYPRERLQFMLSDAELGYIVIQESLVDQLPLSESQIVCLDSNASELQHSNESNPSSWARADNLAYVMYTSGSTGRPKGVQIPHKTVVNFLYSMAEEPGLTSTDQLLSVTRPTFDISVLEFMLPLSVGASVRIASAEVATDAVQLADQISNSAATVIQATPATWQMLIESGWEGCDQLKVLCGGEALTDGLAERLNDCTGELWNMYGPTETTIWSAIYRVQDGCVRGAIGHPIANTQIYVLDDHGEPAPIGMAGELCIAGAGLARGYLNRPELTAEKFIANPFDEDTSSRLYRTGDLCRWRSEGVLEFLGRIDGQVKLRGHRIELGEIETALNDHPGVVQSVVILREDRPGNKFLAAYCVPRNNAQLNHSELRNHIRRTLPEYMVPATVTLLARLPLTSSGKIDRRVLPVPKQSTECELTPAIPTDLLERRVQQIWQRLFERNDIGRDDNFFDLGGHSLLAVRVVTDIEKILGWRLPVASLFQAPTIASLAKLIREKNGDASPRASLVPLQPQGKKPPFFFVHGWGGEVFVFENLARCLTPHQPVYGLRAIDPFDENRRHQSVEEMAAHYVKEILTFQPEGPYHIGGYSAGGWIAYEIAQQLTRQGEAVRMLSLLDTGAISRIPKRTHWRLMAPHLTRRLLTHIRHCFRLSPPELVRYVTGRCSALRTLLFGASAQRESGRGSEKQSTLTATRERTKDYYQTLVSLYQPEKYAGTVDLFAIDSAKHKVPPERLFKHYSRGDVRIHYVTGDHDTIIDNEHAQEFAQVFQQAIEAA